MMFTTKTTERGFTRMEFADHYDAFCSIQESSAASEPCIWLGVNDASPKILASQAAAHGVKTEETTGWVPYPVPEAVSMTTRMHLNIEQANALIDVLKHFVKTGQLPKGTQQQ